MICQDAKHALTLPGSLEEMHANAESLISLSARVSSGKFLISCQALSLINMIADNLTAGRLIR